MNLKRMGIIAILLFVMIAMAVMPVEAKTYYTVSKGTSCEHTAVRYEHSEIASSMQKYVDHVEYDLKYNFGPCGFGVRFYYTDEGRKSIAAGNTYLLDDMAYSVMNAPEWYKQRTYQSVRMEILMHAKWGKSKVDIEYFYKDLKFWEVPYNIM